MRYLIISDIHANITALEAVLADARGNYDTILNCGDLVGYGPRPNEVTDWCRTTPQHIVRGNHDKAAVGLIDLEWFNPDARTSAVWTNGKLGDEQRDFIRGLAHGPATVDKVAIMHGSPADEDEYLMNTWEVENVIPELECDVSFFGHTHLQGAFWIHRNGVKRLSQCEIVVDRDAWYLINPGSVGQPRDLDPRAAYALYDTDERLITLHRVQYDVCSVQADILDAGLPEMLAARLAFGR